MNAMWAGFAAVIVIAVVAGVVLTGLDQSATEAYSEPGVRPPPQEVR